MTYQVLVITEDDSDGFRVIAEGETAQESIKDEYEAGELSINGGHTLTVEGNMTVVGRDIEVERRDDVTEGLVDIAL